MKILQFKTNINCNGCIAKVTPFLNDSKGIEKWDVDITNPAKILTVETNALSSEEVIQEVKKGGFKIEEIRIS